MTPGWGTKRLFGVTRPKQTTRHSKIEVARILPNHISSHPPKIPGQYTPRQKHIVLLHPPQNLIIFDTNLLWFI